MNYIADSDQRETRIGYCYISEDEILEHDDYYIEEQSDGNKRYILKENIDEYVLDQYKQECIDGMILIEGDF